MPERFTERLRQEAAGIWEAQSQHPFVRGIGDGTLSLDRFKFWLRQDYLFLIEYARLLGLGRRTQSRPGDNDPLRHAAQGNCGNRDEPSPGVCRRVPDQSPRSWSESPSHPLLAPTRISCCELQRRAISLNWLQCCCRACGVTAKSGLRLAADPHPVTNAMPSGSAMYSSPEFAELAEWCRDLFDTSCCGSARARLTEAASRVSHQQPL